MSQPPRKSLRPHRWWCSLRPVAAWQGHHFPDLQKAIKLITQTHIKTHINTYEFIMAFSNRSNSNSYYFMFSGLNNRTRPELAGDHHQVLVTVNHLDRLPAGQSKSEAHKYFFYSIFYSVWFSYILFSCKKSLLVSAQVLFLELPLPTSPQSVRERATRRPLARKSRGLCKALNGWRAKTLES